MNADYRSGARCEFLARLSGSITSQGDNRDYLGRPRISLLEMLVSWLGRVIFRKSRPRETPFGQRSPEEIRLWRRTADIRIRS